MGSIFHCVLLGKPISHRCLRLMKTSCHDQYSFIFDLNALIRSSGPTPAVLLALQGGRVPNLGPVDVLLFSVRNPAKVRSRQSRHWRPSSYLSLILLAGLLPFPRNAIFGGLSNLSYFLLSVFILYQLRGRARTQFSIPVSSGMGHTLWRRA
jgi:hypothetical protein